MCPAPAPPPACGRLPRLDHSTITLPGSTRLAPATHHWSHITPPSQPVSRWPVPMFRQSPVCWPAQAAASSSGQPRLLFPGSLRTAARDPARQHPATTAAPAALYSTVCTVCTVPMNVESRGWRNVRWQRPPPPCTRSPSGVRGPGPAVLIAALAEIMMRRLGYLVSCILYLVFCCHIFTSYLPCAAPALTTLLTCSS